MNINSIIFQQADLGDYIFLILVVVASIIQAFTQNKKKKVLQEQSEGKKWQNNDQETDTFDRTPEVMSRYDTPIDNIFDSIERTLVPELDGGKHRWGDDYAEIEEENEDVADTRGGSANVETFSTPVAEKHTIPLAQKSATDLPAISYKSGIRKGFSLRKAVIYSEILNRKYT
jgi:hypothetical protein